MHLSITVVHIYLSNVKQKIIVFILNDIPNINNLCVTQSTLNREKEECKIYVELKIKEKKTRKLKIVGEGRRKPKNKDSKKARSIERTKENIYIYIIYSRLSFVRFLAFALQTYSTYS